MRFMLRLYEDHMPAGTQATLFACNRVVYVMAGETTITDNEASMAVAANSALHSAAKLKLVSGERATRLLRWELVTASATDGGLLSASDAESRAVAAHELDLEPATDYLMRCDQVDFPPGGIAYEHVHAGPGLRYLLAGGLTNQQLGKRYQVRPGETWFERGPDPMYAEAIAGAPTHFVRVMILPRTLKGKKSIRYVNPADDDKPKTQTYRVFLDAFIVLPTN